MPHAPEDLGRRRPHVSRLLENCPAIVDQIEPDMSGRVVVATSTRGAGGPLIRKLNRLARDVVLRKLAASGDLFDDVAVTVARRKIHHSVDAARIFPQLLLDSAHCLDELAPVHRSQKAKTADRIADRYLHAGLFLRFRLDQMLDRKAGFRKPLLDPGQWQRERGAVSLQPARQFGDERTHHRRVRARHIRNHQDQAVGIVFRDVQHLVRPYGGPAPVDGARGNSRADAAQILDQGQTQHDRDRPQFAHLEWRDRLVGYDKAGKALGVDSAIAMGDHFESEVVDPWESGGGPLRQAGKFAAITLWQMPLGRANLLVDQIKIVEQPFRSRRNAAIGSNRRCQQVTYPHQRDLVLGQPIKQLVGCASRRKPVRQREVPTVLLHLVGAEQLRPQWRLIPGILAKGVCSTKVGRDLEQSFENRPLAHFHHRNPPRGNRRPRLLALLSRESGNPAEKRNAHLGVPVRATARETESDCGGAECAPATDGRKHTTSQRMSRKTLGLCDNATIHSSSRQQAGWCACRARL